MRFLRGELALALLFAALGALWLARAARMPLWEGFAPDSGFLPLVYGVLLLALSIAAAVQVARAPAPPGESVRKPLVVLGALAAAVAGLYVAGFVVSVFALLLFLYYRLERLPLATSAIVSAVVTGALYLVFKAWLGVPLP